MNSALLVAVNIIILFLCVHICTYGSYYSISKILYSITSIKKCFKKAVLSFISVNFGTNFKGPRFYYRWQQVYASYI